ncbi:uncharacterized protein LOC107475674 [Arachis duranensis]|uniref:Uncharacterized protein LOC107475674 n=1 Tax=Arachis duranensis TaxID=130453 RepID=A0A6P4CH00_ARADU|nr:uncharacterized protein LOC107475674 [Arachis duranensis]
MSIYSKIQKKKISIEALSQLLVDGSTEIEKQVSNVYPYFQQRVDATGRRDLSPLQKCTAAIRMLLYGVAADAVDDYVRIDESTTIECLEKFVEGVISVFEDEYLRKPNPNDVQRLLQMAEGRGFPGMLGSIDCMHWQWKNCPKVWKGMYMSGYRGVATIVLEVVASSNLWIWHAFFGLSGSNNDIVGNNTPFSLEKIPFTEK